VDDSQIKNLFSYAENKPFIVSTAHYLPVFAGIFQYFPVFSKRHSNCKMCHVISGLSPLRKQKAHPRLMVDKSVAAGVIHSVAAAAGQAFQSRRKLIGVDQIRQQPNGRCETGEHWFSSMTPPACASAWRRSAPRGSVQ
jgi:hypothetical protein